MELLITDDGPGVRAKRLIQLADDNAIQTTAFTK